MGSPPVQAAPCHPSLVSEVSWRRGPHQGCVVVQCPARGPGRVWLVQDRHGEDRATARWWQLDTCPVEPAQCPGKGLVGWPGPRSALNLGLVSRGSTVLIVCLSEAGLGAGPHWSGTVQGLVWLQSWLGN